MLMTLGQIHFYIFLFIRVIQNAVSVLPPVRHVCQWTYYTIYRVNIYLLDIEIMSDIFLLDRDTSIDCNVVLVQSDVANIH